jgi:hypothetical protein
MSAYAKNFSTRLFIQAAFTGLLAPVGSHGSTWLIGTFALAAGALTVGVLAQRGHERTRELVMAFEAVAVAVGVVGLLGHHYIPGTIVGVAALITAANHPMPRAAVAAMPAEAGTVAAPPFGPTVPEGAVPAPQLVAAVPAQPMYAAPLAPPVAEPQPVFAAAPAAPEPPVQPEVTEQQPAPSAYTGVRAMTILPGR